MNLYELSQNYFQLQQMLEDGQIDEQVLLDTMESVDGDIEEKAENYGLIMRNLETFSESLDAEIKRLQARKKSIDTNVSSLKKNLSNTLVALDKTKFKTNHFAFSFRKSESVAIGDQQLLPKEYIKVKTTETADKTAIKKAIKNGETILGAELVQSMNLQIK